ncbi:MAG: ribonuclease HI [Candidatus Pacebacteria bacterium]|nr:ribonuclease HI [Candidatus Paceibacterota bacterium]
MISNGMRKFSATDFADSLVIFTDGSSLGNPGPGGWGAVLVFQKLDEVFELGGNKTKTTNNEMELTAIIGALAHASMNTVPVHVFTDSSYAINGITKWVHGWKRAGWITKDKKPVSHQAIWEQLDNLISSRETRAGVTWHHVPGHVGVPGNERCDEIATSFASGKPTTLYRGKLSQYNHDLLNFTINEEAAAARSDARARAATKAYSYLSLVDGTLEKHTTWTACESRVKGKAGAKFRKSISAEDEATIIKSWGVE